MSLGQLGVGVVVLIIVVFALLTGGVNAPETPALADNADRSIDADATEPDTDDAPPKNSGPETEQESVVVDDDETDDSGDDGITNESGSESGTFETVETGDNDTDSPTRTIRPRGSPVGVLDHNGGDGDDGSSNDSSSGDSINDPSTDDSIDDVSSDDSTDGTDDDTGGDLGDGSNSSDSGDDIGTCTV